MENKASPNICLFLFLAYVKLCLVRFVKATGVEYWNHILICMFEVVLVELQHCK